MQLEPCPSCFRHVRTEETVCPFCAASIASAMAAAAATPRTLPTRRLGRAALVSFGLTVAAAGGAASLQGCGDDGDDDVDHNPVAVYGAPAQPRTDAGKVEVKDAGKPESAQPVYGAPVQPIGRDAGKPIDAGAVDAGASDAGRGDAGDAGAASDAGAVDAGARDAGPRIAPLYGAPVQS